jgi:5-formyltetrahydrofolate cyclo-ligase
MRKLQSANILAALEAHPAFRAANTVLLYHSLNDEVDTHAFIQKWSSEKRILLPVVVGDDLELRIYTGPEDMSISGIYGIAEPTGEIFTDYAAIDFIVVPGVAFDERKPFGTGKRILRSTFTTHTISLQSRYLFPISISRRSSGGIIRHPHGYNHNNQ